MLSLYRNIKKFDAKTKILAFSVYNYFRYLWIAASDCLHREILQHRTKYGNLSV